MVQNKYGVVFQESGGGNANTGVLGSKKAKQEENKQMYVAKNFQVYVQKAQMVQGNANVVGDIAIFSQKM